MAAGTPQDWTQSPKCGRGSASGRPSRELWFLFHPSLPPPLRSRAARAGRHHSQHPQDHKLHFFHLIKQKLPVASLFLHKLIKAFLIHKLRNSRTQLLLSSISDSDISLGPHIIRVSSGTILTSNEKDIVKGVRSKLHHNRYFD